jgi:glucose-1-phosphate adenylyltransferase
VEEGAEVKDAIVMQGCTIEKGASVQYTILDKDVTVKSGTKLLGSAEHPLIIRKGVTV